MASFNAAVASFGCPTFPPLSHAGSHDYTFGFPRNRRFGYSVLHLEGGCFNFPELYPSIWQHSTVRLSWDSTLRFESVDGEPEKLPLHSIVMPWVGSWLMRREYIYPLGFLLPSVLSFVLHRFPSFLSLSCFSDFFRNQTQFSSFTTTLMNLPRKRVSLDIQFHHS